MSERMINEEQSKKIHPIIGYLMMFAYLLTSSEDLQKYVKNPSRTRLFIGFLHMSFVSLLFSLVILGLNDGPELISEFLKGNIRFHSGSLMGYVIFPIILLWFAAMIIMCGIPYFVTKIFMKTDPTIKSQQIFLSSCYGFSSILFYIVLVPTIAWLSVWTQPQMIQLQPSSWTGLWWYFVGLLVLIAILSNYVCLTKMLALKREKAFRISIILFVLVALIFSIFFIL